MKFQTAVKIRRAIVFVIFFDSLAIGIIFNTFLAWIAGAASLSLLFTDSCNKCGAIIFSMCGKGWRSVFDPLYVPSKCSRCGNKLQFNEIK